MEAWLSEERIAEVDEAAMAELRESSADPYMELGDHGVERYVERALDKEFKRVSQQIVDAFIAARSSLRRS